MTFGFSFLNRGVGLLLSTVLAVQPAFVEVASAQQVIIDPNGDVGTRLQAGKPAPVVDIAKPNAGGVSHNRYKKLNAPAGSGVVLNNSAKGGKTAVAGEVSGNPNLTGGSAATIVNEVTSAEASALAGRIEVAGDRADVIMANPNGIACDGCSFLNTKNATLTTGVPVIEGGTVRLDVTQGSVTIGRKGLEGAATGVGAVNLIGRTVVIDGRVTAVDGINVQGGSQRYDVTGGKRVEVLKAAGPAGQDYAIDGTAFGAMEAGRIQIIGNEQGLGVRLRGAVQATASDAAVISPGKVEVSSVSAQRHVTVLSAGNSVEVERDVSAVTGRVKVSAGSTLDLGERSGIYSKTGIELHSAAGELNLLGDLQSSAGIDITGTKLRFSGYATAATTVSFAITDGAVVTGATVVAGQIDGSAFGKSLSVDSSAFFSSQDVQFATDGLSFGRDVVSAGLKDDDKVKLVAKVSGDFRNHADLRNFSAAQITWGGDLYNEAGGVLADKALVLDRAKAIHNSGIIYGEDSLKINAAGFFNNASGSVLSKSVQITSSGALSNLGSIISEGDLRLSAASALMNDGFVQGVHAWLNGQTVENRGKGDLRIASALEMTATGNLTNRGSLNALGTVALQAGRFTNYGMILAEGSIKATAPETSNAGTLVSATLVHLRGDTISSTGTISSYDQVDLVAGKTVNNSGSLVADKTLTISGPAFVNTGSKALVRAKDGRILSATLTNAGKIFLVDDFTRKGNLDLFRNDGVFATAGSISLSGRDAKSQILLGSGSNMIAGLRPDDRTQTLTAGKSVGISAAIISLSGQKTDKTFNRAQIRAGGDIGLATPGVLTIGGSVETKAGNIGLSGADIVLTGTAAVYAGGAGTLNSAGGLSNAGALVVKNQLNLSRDFGRLANSGVLSMGESGKFFGFSGAFTNTGFVGSDAGLSIRAASLVNDGHLQSGAAMNLVTVGETRLRGATVATDWLSITAGQLVLDKGLVTPGPVPGKTAPNSGIISASRLNITADSLVSSGNISLTGPDTSIWKIANDFKQEGLTHSVGSLTITAPTISGTAGSHLGSSRNLVLNGAGTPNSGSFDISGSLAGQEIILQNSDAIFLRAASVLSSAGNIVLDARRIATLAGQVSARNRLDIKAEALTLSGQSYAGVLNATAAAGITHGGASYGKNELHMTSAGRLINSGTISSAGTAVLTARDLLQNAASGKIEATTLAMTVSDAASQAMLDNRGRLFGAQKLTLRSTDLTNAASGQIRAGTADLKTSRHAVNKGSIHGFGIFADIDGNFTNEKVIQGDEIVTIISRTGSVQNTADGRFYGKIIGLAAGAGFVNDGYIGMAGSTNVPDALSVRIAATGVLTNNQRIRGRDVELVGASIVNTTAGTVLADQTLRMQSLSSSIVNHGLLQGDRTALVVKGSIENHNRLVGTKTLGIVSEIGRIYNKGSLQGGEITLIAENGTIVSDTAVGAGSLLLAKTAGAEFKSAISAGNQIGIETTRADLTLGGTATANNIELWSAGLLRAGAGAIRAGTTTQIIAADIQRTDISATNRKLGVVPGSVGNLYIELASGSFGTAPADPQKNGAAAPLSQYEQANLTATGSVEIVASGNLFLTGTIGAQKNTSLYAKEFTALRGANLNAGANLHIQGDRYLKNYGNTALNADTVTLNQKWGWFYTGDWLPEQIGHNLVVGANTIVVNTDHRFINKSVTFRATNDIRQIDSVISARGIEYVAGKSITIDFDPFDWRAQRFTGFIPSYGINPSTRLFFKNDDDHPTLGWQAVSNANKTALSAADTRDWWDTVSGGLRGHTLIAQGAGIKLTAGADVTLRSGKTHSEAGIDITAGGRFLSEPAYIENDETERPVNVGWSFDNRYRDVDAGHDRSRVQMNELRAYENQFSAKGNINISAVRNVDLIGTRISSVNGSISLKSALGGINMLGAPGFWAYDYEKKKTRGNLLSKRTTYIGVSRYFDIYKKTSLAAANGNIDIVSTGALIRDGATTYPGADPQNAVVSAGTELSAQNVTVMTRHASQSILLGTYAEESVDETKTWSKRKILAIIPAGSSDSIRSRRVTMQIGNDFLADEILELKSAANLTIVGGSLKGKTIKVAAAGNLNVQAAINSVYESNKSRTDNMVTITTINSGKIVETAELPKITSVQPATFDIGGKVTISGYTGPALNTLVINSISSRKFDDRMLRLYTPKDAAAAGKQGKEVSGSYDYVLPKGGDHAYLQTLLKDKGATYETITLRNQTWYDKQVQMNPAFQALLTVAISTATGGIAGLTAWQKAALDSALNSAATGAATGNFNAEQALRSALTAGASSYISGELIKGFGLAPPKAGTLTVDGVQNNFTPQLIRDRFGSQLISHGVSNVTLGKSPLEGLDKLGRNFLVTESMGIIQNGIGDLGIGKGGKWEGSPSHLALHGGLGCVAMAAMGGKCSAGFFAAASQAALSGSNLSDADKASIVPLAGAMAGFLAGDGNAINVSFGATIAESGFRNNYLTHKQLADLEAQLEKCSGKADPALCQSLLEERARSLSAAQDIFTSVTWARCKLGNPQSCTTIDSQLDTIKNLNEDSVVADIRKYFPKETDQELRIRAKKYIDEFRDSYDAAFSRTVFGTLDVAGNIALAGGAAEGPARATARKLIEWLKRSKSPPAKKFFDLPPDLKTWNQFQAATRSQFISRADAAKGWEIYKKENKVQIVTQRNKAARSFFLKQLAASGKAPKWMNQYLSKGKVPPGYQVDHQVALSAGGLDGPTNRRLKDIATHKTRHKYYRPWE